jgi:hypothetical protein
METGRYKTGHSGRRKTALRRKCALAAGTSLLFISMAFSLCSGISNANTNIPQPSYKYYTSRMVEYGDTLWSIALNHADRKHYGTPRDYIQEVMRINHLEKEDLRAGQYLIIPYYSEDFVK